MEPHSERRLVTCLFVDVVGSTDATVRLGPERMQRLLADAFAEMSATISDQGGTVEKYVGDAIFALFGAPTARIDDAERALRAADACARWSSAPGTSAVRLGVRIGIETGEALVDLTAVEHRQRMAVGECVNVAARLQQQAEPGEIVVGPMCREVTKAAAQFESLGMVSLKGLGEVEGWRFTSFGTEEGGREIPFVGRDRELGVLGQAFQRANAGNATLALIVGPPGQGKTRLAHEAIRQSGAALLIQARCRPGAESGINTPLRQMVTADVPDADADAVRDRLSTLLGSDDGVEAAAAVSHSAGLAVDERLLALGRMEQRELIAESWRRYLSAIAHESALIAWIEDVHWADPVLLRVVDHVTSSSDAPILVIATARPEFVGSAHLRTLPNRLQLDLEPLDPMASERLAELAGDGTTNAARAAGNPLFIIELARSRTAPDDLPVTVQAAIESRLDELSPFERDLLQRASVVGETFDVRDAALLVEREPAEVAGALGRIAYLGFVEPLGSTYRFHHALVREVAYGRLPVAERMELHARYARDGVDPADVEALAHHWWEAVKPPDAQWVWEDAGALVAMRRNAFPAQMAAARHLEERNAYEEALDVYLQAVELADDGTDLASAHAGVGRAYARQGRGDEAWQHRLQAIAIFAETGSPAPAELYAEMLEIATLNWGFFNHLPEDAEVLRLLDEGERGARESGDDVSLARLIGERAAFTNDLAGTEEVQRFIASPDAVRFADPLQRLGELFLWNGRVAGGVELFKTVFERLVPGGGIVNEPEALLWYAAAAFNAGNLELATTLAERLATEAARRSPHTRQHSLAMKALIQLGMGAWPDLAVSSRELDELVDANPEAAFCLLGGLAVGYGAIAELVAGRPLPAGLDERLARMVPESTLIQASCVMLPKVMVGTVAALDEGVKAYTPGLRLWDRAGTWDVCHLLPAIALTMAERWDDLGPTLDRLDLFAANGGLLAAAVASAIREERAAATEGGPQPGHSELKSIGCAGLSELLRYRPTKQHPV
jgi:class 3 adenylate cyclase/tetratricopeptide (TPR) repeat protein